MQRYLSTNKLFMLKVHSLPYSKKLLEHKYFLPPFLKSGFEVWLRCQVWLRCSCVGLYKIDDNENSKGTKYIYFYINTKTKYKLFF